MKHGVDFMKHILLILSFLCTAQAFADQPWDRALSRDFAYCSVQAGPARTYYDMRCRGRSEVLVGIDQFEPPVIRCAELRVNCPQEQVADLRWDFQEGSNHFLGICTHYHNSGDPNGQICYREGERTTWRYAYAQGGCAPQYAEWENTYICRRYN